MNRLPSTASWHVISLRPVGAHQAMRRAAAHHGWPLLALSPWRLQARGGEAACQAVQTALACDRVIVTSPAAATAANALFPLASACVQHWLAVGDGTRRALLRHGVTTAVAPRRMDSEGLLAMPALQQQAVRGRRVGMITAPEGRGRLQAELQARGAVVVQADVYDRVAVRPSPQAVARLQRLQPPYWLALSSGQALTCLLTALPQPARLHLLQAHVVTASSRLAQLAADSGFHGDVIEAASARPDDLLSAIASHAAAGVCSASPVR